jgi:tRNA pseudouridine65 synthase
VSEPDASRRSACETLYRDDDAVFVCKPAGLLVHGSAFAGARERTALDIVREAHGADLHPLHRLDRGTSGVLGFARGAANLRAWQAALAAPDVVKRYVALVRGRLDASVEVDHPVPDADGVRRPARSFVEPLASLDEPRCGLVRVRLYTGRMHQVRRHLKHLSHPVIGDANYGKGPLNRWYRERYGLARLALHATELRVTHPLTGAVLALRAELPDDLAGPLAAIFGDAFARVAPW